MKTLTLTKTMHGVLYQRYDLAKNRMVHVGDSKGYYGPEDLETGAEYKVLSSGERNGKPLISRDYQAGPFYPATLFIWGKDDKGNLSFEQLEEFAKTLGYTKHKRVILPNGWSAGRMTWDYALCFVPPEWAPSWYGIQSLLEARFPKAEIYNAGSYVEMTLDT